MTIPLTHAEAFELTAGLKIKESTGDIWTALENVGVWPSTTKGLITFNDDSTLTESECLAIQEAI